MTENITAILFLFILSALFSGEDNSEKERLTSSAIKKEVRRLDEFPAKEMYAPAKNPISNSAANLNLKNDAQLNKIKTLTKLGYSLFLKDKLDSALTVNKKALKLAKTINNQKIPAIIYNQIGLIYWKKGNYKKAESYYLKSLQINKNVPIEEAKSYNYLGLIYWKLSDFSQALEYYLRSLKIKEQLGNKYEIALTLNNIATLFNIVKDTKSAIRYSKKALKIAKEIDDNYVKGRAYQNLGVSYLENKIYDVALKYLNYAIQIREEEHQSNGLAYSYLKRGDVLFNIGQYNEAKTDYEKALEIMEEKKDNYGIASAHLALGKIYDKQNKNTLAIIQYEESLKYAKTENLHSLERKAHLKLSDLYQKIEDYKKALEEYSKYVELDKVIDNITLKEKFGKLKLEYETEVQQKENELLKTKNKFQEYELKKNKTYKVMFIGITIFTLIAFFAVYSRYNLVKKTRNLLREKNKKIEKQRKELKQLVDTKDKMFSIIAHDLKSPFQSLQGYSELLVKEFEDLDDKEKLEYISNIKRISKNSTDLVNNLLQWTRAQSGSLEYKPENLNLKQITDSTIELAKSTADRKQIKIISKITPNIYVYADKNIITTVLRNLLNNAIKFSQQNSTIEIFTTVKENNIILNIKDNGIGIETERLGKIFDVCTSTSGTENEIGSGLGLALCKELVTSYNGSITVESQVNKGSIFSFTIPLYKLEHPEIKT